MHHKIEKSSVYNTSNTTTITSTNIIIIIIIIIINDKISRQYRFNQKHLKTGAKSGTITNVTQYANY
jgi:hypothetical protein